MSKHGLEPRSAHPAPSASRAPCARLLLLVALLFGAVRARADEPLWTDAPRGPAVGLPGSLADISRMLARGTVRISTTSEGGGRRGRPESATEYGSGFLVNEDGLILTADSVIRDAERIRVELASGRDLPATLVGRDFATGLALLEIDAPDEALAPLSFGTGEDVRVGDWAAALGHTDEGAATLSKGIVSARDRWLPGNVTGASPGYGYGRYLQLDMGTVIGFAGAPLVDMNGRVIGVLSASSTTEGSSIGFAIPVETAKQILPQLAARGHVDRGWLGVKINRVTPEIAASFELTDTTGALVEDVYEDSPASRAAIETGDVVVEFDGAPIRMFADLSQRVGVTPPGSEVDVVVVRGGQRRTLHARIDPREQSARERQLAAVGRPGVDAAPDPSGWGFDFAPLDGDLRVRFSLDPDASGFVVSRVEPGSPAQRSGLQLGDLLRDVGRAPITSEADLRGALKRKTVVLRIRRGRRSRYVVLKP